MEKTNTSRTVVRIIITSACKACNASASSFQGPKSTKNNALSYGGARSTVGHPALL